MQKFYFINFYAIIEISNTAFTQSVVQKFSNNYIWYFL